ncbi:MAG: hypothetical protein OXG37_08975 [Actinomycetia bacterium]|nr:hypothetical protein [Actinomycetes bacterium]
MATKKQRRRRAKIKRHQWEYVETTEEGEEVVLDSPREQRRRDGDDKKDATQMVDRRGRPIQKPSLQRVLKRGAIFGPLLFILVFITAGELSTTQKILQSVFLVAIFLPFSYFMDVMLYRFLTRRQQRQ